MLNGRMVRQLARLLKASERGLNFAARRALAVTERPIN